MKFSATTDEYRLWNAACVILPRSDTAGSRAGTAVSSDGDDAAAMRPTVLGTSAGVHGAA